MNCLVFVVEIWGDGGGLSKVAMLRDLLDTQSAHACRGGNGKRQKASACWVETKSAPMRRRVLHLAPRITHILPSVIPDAPSRSPLEASRQSFKAQSLLSCPTKETENSPLQAGEVAHANAWRAKSLSVLRVAFARTRSHLQRSRVALPHGADGFFA